MNFSTNSPKPANGKDLSLVTELMAGVRDAVPPGGTEKDVVTYISRPMWRRWCEDLGEVQKVQKGEHFYFIYPEPSEKWGTAHARVYGSVTVIVESDQYFAISRALGGKKITIK